jgi:alanine racemase
MQAGHHTTWLEIDLSAVQQNIRKIQSITAVRSLAVVKANGYGHGMVEAARAAVSGGAAWLCVARIDEALALRQAGLSLPLLVMGYCMPERVPEAITHEIRLAVFDPDLTQSFAAQARAVGGVLRVHVKLDTGMGRLGVFPERALDLIRQFSGQPELAVEGLFTHFARADEPQLETTMQQMERFNRVIDSLTELDLRPRLVHAANSAAALNFPQARYDLVRPGIAIYGLHPSQQAPLPDGFAPALAWKARLASIKAIPAGHGISYTHRYTTRRTERIGVLPVGYADGFRRRPGNFALVGGQRVPVVGGICMDQCMLQLDSVPQVQPGDEVVLIGRQGDQTITSEELAQEWGTINYEVVCGLAARLPRLYL